MSLCQFTDENVLGCVFAVTLLCASFTPTEIQYCLIFFFFVFLKASLPRPLSLSHVFLHCAPFSESTEVSSYFRGNKLSVSPFFSNCSEM